MANKGATQPKKIRRSRKRKVRRALHQARQRAAVWATAFVIGLHAALLAVLVARPMGGPIDLPVIRLVWAWKHERVIYLLVMVLLTSAVLSIVAMAIEGWHRLWLLLTWIVLILLCATRFREPVTAMLEMVFKQL